MTGTSEKSGGGITTVIKNIKSMPIWEKYNIYWLATQVDDAPLSKLWCVVKAALKSLFVIAKCDIVHFQMVPGITLLTQLPALFCAKIYRKKVVMTVHVGNQLVPYAKDRFFKWWLGRADLVLLLAKKWDNLFRELYSDVKVPSDVLYNACEMKQYIPMNQKEKLILFCGTIHDNKAPDLLLKAWADLKNKYPEWQIVFLGRGEIDYYKQMAESLGIIDKVSFTGYIEGSEKEYYFRKASIYTMCSYMEGFPMTVLEAWAYSIAVVTTPVGGLPDAIEEDINCLSFPMGDSKALAKQLDKLISNDEKRMYIAQNGHEYANTHFSVEAINEKLDSIYASMLR